MKSTGTYEIREHYYGGGYRVLDVIVNDTRKYARNIRNGLRRKNPSASIHEHWVTV